jgi:hypothetical protein
MITKAELIKLLQESDFPNDAVVMAYGRDEWYKADAVEIIWQCPLEREILGLTEDAVLIGLR